MIGRAYLEGEGVKTSGSIQSQFFACYVNNHEKLSPKKFEEKEIVEEAENKGDNTLYLWKLLDVRILFLAFKTKDLNVKKYKSHYVA